MNGEPTPMTIRSDSEAAIALHAAVQTGDVDAISGLLADHPGLAGASIVTPGRGSKTPLHLVADWPGYFPNGPEIVKLLIGAGADPNVPGVGKTGEIGETPLHWAASSDDVEVAVALIDGGADIEAPGGSIAGSPLANAVGYACWQVAELLAERGAHIGSLWEAAALGNRPKVDELLAADPPPTAEDIGEAFWQSCNAGQYRMAAHLLDRGANINFKPDYSKNTPLEAATQAGTQRMQLATFLRDRGAATS